MLASWPSATSNRPLPRSASRNPAAPGGGPSRSTWSPSLPAGWGRFPDAGSCDRSRSDASTRAVSPASVPPLASRMRPLVVPPRRWTVARSRVTTGGLAAISPVRLSNGRRPSAPGPAAMVPRYAGCSPARSSTPSLRMFSRWRSLVASRARTETGTGPPKCGSRASTAMSSRTNVRPGAPSR